MTSGDQQIVRRRLIVQRALQSPGQPLKPAVRAYLENKFHRDFRGVRIHVGAAASAAARALKAQAFAVGPDVFFGSGRYDAKTDRGLWLIAHELAHVVQQSCPRGPALRKVGIEAALERAAVRAADLVVAGRALPRHFALGAAPPGVPQCHDDVPCPGTRISARDRSIWMPANEAIEIAYRAAPGVRPDAIFFGSQFEWNDVRLPSGAPNKRYGNLLLSKLRGLQNQRRPDIIDFGNRVFYEIKSVDDTARGTVQLESYYRVAEEIRLAHADFDEPPWRVEYATWYPPHVLPLPSDPQDKIVCTQETNHTTYPGLILYDVREVPRRRRRRQPSTRFQLEDFEPAETEFAPGIRAQLPKSIPFFDPESPDYIIVVPQEFFTLDYMVQKGNKEWDKLRMKVPFADMHNEMAVANRFSWLIIAIAGTAGIAGICIAAAPAVGAGAGVATAVEVVESTGAGAGVVSTIVAPGEIAAQVAPYAAATSGAGAAGGAAATAGGAAGWAGTAAFQAQLAAPAVKAAAALAGALLVLGNVRSASAATSDVQLDHVVSIRALPIDDFKIDGAVPQGRSAGPGSDVCLTPEAIKKKFGLGTKVLYDNKPYWIIGRFTVK